MTSPRGFLRNENAKLSAERDALAAGVARLRAALIKLVNAAHNSTCDSAAISAAQEAIRPAVAWRDPKVEPRHG